MPQHAERASYYARIGESLHALVPAEPVTACVAALWRWDEVYADVMEAGDIISAEEAIRRVLILENPGLRGASSITTTLYAGLQLICAQPPPCAVGAALHHGGRGRVHGGQRRAHHHAARRFHHHPQLDLARPRQPYRCPRR